jgi:hypothetical protein
MKVRHCFDVRALYSSFFPVIGLFNHRVKAHSRRRIDARLTRRGALTRTVWLRQI